MTAGGVLAEPEWRARKAAHEARVDVWTGPHLQRRSRGEPHPVEDFLFDYYPNRPAKLRRWHSGPGVWLSGDTSELETWPGYVRDAKGLRVDAGAVLAKLGPRFDRIVELLRVTTDRPAMLGCFGLHEWAMVHGSAQDELRHAGTPLRLSPAATSQVVEDLGVRCTHFDAFRFFTPTARPLNVLQPTRASQLALEQPGCLHANMDLYRWAYELVPLVPSELVADAFELARDVRVLDMRASPYDLASLGYLPIRIETADGRAEYVSGQRALAARAAPIRTALLACCDASTRT